MGKTLEIYIVFNYYNIKLSFLKDYIN